jgi:hypothetical protein
MATTIMTGTTTVVIIIIRCDADKPKTDVIPAQAGIHATRR